MSNPAPPGLIQDSLHTTLEDELEHALTAFEMTSLCLMEQHTEPGVLAPSKNLCDSNLTALALGAVSQGCIEEMLLTLRLALDVVDKVAGKMDNLDGVNYY